MEWMLMPLRRYAQFSGRSRRKEYWMFVLFVVLATLLIGTVESLLGIAGTVGDTGPVSALFSLLTLIPSIAVGVRRLHDTNRSGWWLLLPLAPYAVFAAGMIQANTSLLVIGGLAAFATAVIIIVFMCLDGQRGTNRFGDDPKGAAHSEIFA